MWVKSSYSASAECVELWRTSSYSESGNCTEVAAGDDGALVRDSKNKTGPVLRFPAAAWAAFTTTLKEKHDA